MDGDGLEGMRPSLLKGSIVVCFWFYGEEDRAALIKVVITDISGVVSEIRELSCRSSLNGNQWMKSEDNPNLELHNTPCSEEIDPSY
ncbi:hypothetical protein CEXT_157461 [Caerostris extrusa]|uniref:Uncharacterized protein n=1 Tax=Caerostris extrusa TaxID=172846 RepID=A0AAV4UWD9_CAEEX|nr:hypothetical protein CEXT_157461 [Caerostris extrusa]